MRMVVLDTDMFNPDMVSDEAWKKIETRFLGKPFDLDTMTPTEKDEFDKLQDLINFCRDREKKRGLDPVYARVTEAEWESYRKRGQARMLREAKEESKTEIASLKKEVDRLSQDRTYWQSRTQVLTDILEKVSPETIRTQDRINAEFMARMVYEEAVVRVRNDEYKKTKIDSVKDWGSPLEVFQMLQSVYIEEFPDLLSRPLDPDGQEPWWQRYVKMVRDRSPSDRVWVENAVMRRAEVVSEWRERTKLYEALTDRTKLYLESVLWDVPFPSQELIRKIVSEINSGTWAKIDWKTFESGSDARIRELMPDRIGANIPQIQDDYARANAKAWEAAAELYLKKCATVERGEMTRLADFSTGYMPKEKANPVPQDPDRFEFEGSGPRI